MDVSGYIGPYIKVENISHTIQQVVNACVNKSCVKHKKVIRSKFCPECGSKIDKITMHQEKNFDVHGFLYGNEMLDNFSHIGFCVIPHEVFYHADEYIIDFKDIDQEIYIQDFIADEKTVNFLKSLNHNKIQYSVHFGYIEE